MHPKKNPANTDDLGEVEALRKQNVILRRQKNALLKEAQNRVNDNLQIVSSLLDLSGKQFMDSDTAQRLSEVQIKVHALGFIYTQIYDYLDGDLIDMEQYIQNLVSEISRQFFRPTVTTHIDCPDVHMPLYYALPAAMIFNELIINAFKHPFKKRKSGRINIALTAKEDGFIQIDIKDNGTGLPDNLDIFQTEAFGLKLVRNIALKQLKGKISVRRQRGTNFKIVFRLDKSYLS